MSLSPIDALASGYTVIVPNNRAQQTWTDLYLKKGKTLPGQLLQSFSEFVTSLIKRNKAFFKQRILTDQQAMIALLQSLPQTFHRDCGQQFLHSFIQAYKLIGRWRCSIDELKNYRLTQEQQYFYEQAPLFKKWLEQQHLMTLEMAIEALLGENNCIWSSPNYFFYGFDDFYPLQEALFAKMRQDGINLVFDKVVPIHSSVRKYVYPHQADELKAALNWLSEQPRYQRSVVVVFEMNKEFRQIADQVVLHYNQNLARIPLEQGLDKVALSSGEPLIHHPLIAELFTLLVGQKSIPTFFIDSTLVIASLDLNKLLVRSLQAWNNFLIELLVTAQWCQDIQLTSHEYQARAMFLVKIQELSQRCSSFVSDCSYGQWVYLLKLFIASTTFQPQSLSQEHSLMGLLEAAPLGFDHVWLIGADFMKIPQSLNPHPLLPTEFQEKYSMPHAHIQREMTYLKSILARVFQAQDCTISYAQTDGVKMIHSSPMLDRLLPGTYEKQDSLMTQSSFLNLSFFKQEYVKSVLSHRVTVAQLNQFLQCPFRGMSRTLSGVEAPVQTKLPIDPARHGQLMHQYIQERLKNESGEHALQRYVHSWPKQLQATERHRLEHLYGLVRQHFVGGTEQLRFEQKVSFYMGRWLIEGRADIWDPEAEHVYDIKSKNFSVSSWFSSEPTDIQGSLYTIGLKAKALGLIRLTQPTVFITSESVASYLPDWSSQVQRLLKRWDEGNFEPAPQHSGICHHCRLKKACRYVAP